MNWRKEARTLLMFPDRERHIAMYLRDMYILGLKQGYQMADDDFFRATRRDGEPDQDWHVHHPSLTGALAAYKGWEKRKNQHDR